MTDRRYPLQALLDAARMTMDDLRQHVSIGGPTYRNARDRGLRRDQADRWAMAVGLHPSVVWPDWMDDQIESILRPCAECGTPFAPKQSNYRFCKRACRRRRIERERKRRKYRENPEAERARVAAYQADPRVAAVRRVKAKLRYQATKVAVTHPDDHVPHG